MPLASCLNRPNACTSLERELLYICSIVREELFYGAYKSAQIERNLVRLERLFDEFSSLPFDDRCGSIAGRIRARLAALGTPIGAYDLQIAAIALANNLILVTHNTREFSRVEGLTIDWINYLPLSVLRNPVFSKNRVSGGRV